MEPGVRELAREVEVEVSFNNVFGAQGIESSQDIASSLPFGSSFLPFKKPVRLLVTAIDKHSILHTLSRTGIGKYLSVADFLI